MKEFRNKIAVITGAASGIGRALAEQAAKHGMKLVLADVNQRELQATKRQLDIDSTHVLSVITDVSKREDVERLANETLKKFNGVHLLFNNAGVTPHASAPNLWDVPYDSFRQVVDVNLWGVIHGIQVFLPIMLHMDDECHVVNTGSVMGLHSRAGNGVYSMTKHAVVSISETIHLSLMRDQAAVSVSVLCPGWVQTHLVDSPEERDNPLSAEQDDKRWKERSRSWGPYGRVLSPERVAEMTFDGIVEKHFYILTHPEWLDLVAERMNNILSEQNPKLPSEK